MDKISLIFCIVLARCQDIFPANYEVLFQLRENAGAITWQDVI